MEILNPTVFWLLAVVILVIIEIITMGLTTIWFAGGAVVAAVAAAVHAPLYIQVALFITISVVLLIFTRPVAMKYFNKNRTQTNVDSVIGRQAVVLKEIDNLMGTGQVSLEGMEWTARTKEAGMKIHRDAVVRILAVDGVKLIVEEIRKEEIEEEK